MRGAWGVESAIIAALPRILSTKKRAGRRRVVVRRRQEACLVAVALAVNLTPFFSIPQPGNSRVLTSPQCGPGEPALHTHLRQPAVYVHQECINTPDYHATRLPSSSLRCAARLGKVVDTQTPQMAPPHSCAEERRK